MNSKGIVFSRLLFSGLLFSALMNASANAEQGWRLTFADEFNGMQPGEDATCYNQPAKALCTNRYWSTTTCEDAVGASGVDPDLNTCNWVVMDHMNWMWGSENFNAFDASLVEVKDGYLSLPARRNPSPGSCAQVTNPTETYEILSTDCPVLSGAIWSRKMSTWDGGVKIENDGFAQEYGRFEVRAKIPTGAGSFPAHWLLPQSGGWPEAGEIDIMEYTINSGLHGTFHGGRAGPPKLKHHVGHHLEEHYLVSDERLESTWHTYAVEWTPDELRFYFDDIHYGTMKNGDPLPTHVLDTKVPVGDYPALVPKTAFYLILNTTVRKFDFPGEQVPANWAGLEHKIDYVRVYEECNLTEADCKVLEPWFSKHGSGTGKIAYWNMSSDDDYLAADFDADGQDELLALNAPWAHLIERRNTSGWQDAWSWKWGSGAGKIGYWNMHDSDRYLAGNFVSEAGTPRAELLSIRGAWSHITRFNGSDWQWYSGNGSGSLGSWNISSDDKYLVGNFDGQGTDELLAIKGNHAQLLSLENKAWKYRWGTASRQIHYWIINPGDRYLVGDFNDDGKDELLAIHGNWVQLMAFKNGAFKMIWSNNGDGRINWWNIKSNVDSYTAADLTGSGDFLIANNEPWSHVMKFKNGDWQTDWGSYGGLYDGWYYHAGDRYIVGDWLDDDGEEILAIKKPHWQIINYLFK